MHERILGARYEDSEELSCRFELPLGREPGMRNHSNFTVVPVPAPVPGFFTGSSSGSSPAQQAKTNTTHLRLLTRCFSGGRTLCTHWLHTGADLIQGIVSYVRIKTRTKKFFRTTLTRRPYLMHSENSHLCEHREIPTYEEN